MTFFDSLSTALESLRTKGQESILSSRTTTTTTATTATTTTTAATTVSRRTLSLLHSRKVGAGKTV